MKLSFSPEQRVEIRSRMVVIAFTLALLAIIYYFSSVWSFVSRVFSLFSPFLVGVSIAFLINPMQKRIERIMHRFIFKNKAQNAVRILSTILAMLLLVVIVGVFLSIIVPQVVQSLYSVTLFVKAFIEEHMEDIRGFLVKYNILDGDTNALIADWNSILSRILNHTPSVLGGIISLSGSIANFVCNLAVSLITAIYILLDRENLFARCKKIGFSLIHRDHMETLVYWTRRAGSLFSGFINGKILDSAIIGCLCYIGMLIFGWEYPVLISVVMGLTNIIPFFGPFIGWIPSALILLIINPVHALWFSIFILVLQQTDGNVIGPFILGDRVGVSALSIMIAIVVGSGLFGFAGMLLSVPCYALLYAIIRTVVSQRLKEKGLSDRTKDYQNAPEELKPYTEA